MFKYIQYTGLVTAMLACVSCDKVKEEIANAESALSRGTQNNVDMDPKTAHSNAAVDSLNNVGIDNADYIYNRYNSWVKSPDGPTGKEKINWGIGKFSNASRDLAKINKVIKMDAYPELSEQAKVYKEAYETLDPLLSEANQYYKREDYKDDDFKKGRELHAKFMPAFDEFFAKRRAYRDVLAGIQDAVMLAELEKAKAEGRNIEFETKSSFRVCDKIWTLANQQDMSAISLEKVQEQYDLLTKFIESQKVLAEGLDDKEKASLTRYIGGLEEVEINTTKLMRNLKKEESASKIEGSLRSLLSSYNSLVSRYNSIVNSTLMMK